MYLSKGMFNLQSMKTKFANLEWVRNVKFTICHSIRLCLSLSYSFMIHHLYMKPQSIYSNSCAGMNEHASPIQLLPKIKDKDSCSLIPLELQTPSSPIVPLPQQLVDPETGEEEEEEEEAEEIQMQPLQIRSLEELANPTPACKEAFELISSYASLSLDQSHHREMATRSERACRHIFCIGRP